MPNRIIKESICLSTEINNLNGEEEAFFYRLIVNCDDYGRIDGRIQVLRAKCYPLRTDTMTEDVVGALVSKLVRTGLIIKYTVANMPYLKITTWDKHQQIRAKKSKFPAPDEGVIVNDNNGNQMITNDNTSKRNQLQSNVPVIQSNPIQSESNPNPKDSETEVSGFQPSNNGFDKCFSFKDYQLLERVSVNKVGFLMTTFLKLHPSAPPDDFKQGRMAGLWSKMNKDTGYVLKLIWDTSSNSSLAGSHISYMQRIAIKSKPIKEDKSQNHAGMKVI